MQWNRVCLVAGWLLVASVSARAAEAVKEKTPFAHPFGGSVFRSLVEDSCRTTGLGSPDDFYVWMGGDALRAAQADPAGKVGADWPAILARHRTDLEQAADPEERSRREMALATWLHKTIKRAIPNYSLERGYELSNVPKREERQCLLQSILISSLLQAMGVDAGIAMVNCNREGQYVNNEHVIVMLKMAKGRDAIVDASYPQTLVAHRGLMAMLADGSYRYVRPVYSEDFREIISYREVPGNRALECSMVRPMNVTFVQSQIDYFRGERTPDGVLSRDFTAAGLERSRQFFEASLDHCPANPVPAYMLGLIYEKRGRIEKAFQQYRLAREIYDRAGWAPAAVSSAIARTKPRNGI